MTQRALACGVAGAAKLCAPHGLAVAGLIVLWLVELCVFVYASVRLIYFLPAVVVAEERIGLGRAWALGGGNFWRIVLVFVVSVVPVAIIVAIVSHLTIDPIVRPQLMALHPTGQPHHPLMLQAMVVSFHAQLSIWPVVLVINLVQRIVYSGLICGAIGTAYKAVTAAEK
jgi:hypothetical protein